MSFAITAVALTAATGIYTAISMKSAADDQADLAEHQSKVNSEALRREAEDDSRADSQQAQQLRDAQRRRRATIEAGYAKSGVILEGTPADMLVNQREADEQNVKTMEWEGNERRKRMMWQADTNQRLGSFEAGSIRRQGNAQFISGIGKTGTRVAGGIYQVGKTKKWWV